MDAAIELDGLVKQFGVVRAVGNVSLRVDKGAIYGLIGPNGAGKTTTFSILAGYLSPTRGSAKVLGHDPRDVGALKGKVGVLPQDALLPPTERVGAFLVHLARLQGLAKTAAFDSARSALTAVGGVEWWDLRCGGLSHGMAKRVGLAQAVLGKPELVLLDEPTAGLDPKVAYHVRQFIKGLGDHSTVVVSSHNLQELEEVCSGAAILDRGLLVSSGSMSQLTGAGEEIRIQLASGPPVASLMETIRALPAVSRAEFDAKKAELVVGFDPAKHDAETVIGSVLRALLDASARISGVAKGRRLEQRVMELT